MKKETKFKKIEDKYGYSLPKDLDKIKNLAEKSNSIDTFIALSGISKHYTSFIFKEFNISITPKCLHCGKVLEHNSDTGNVKLYCDNKCRYAYNNKFTNNKCSVCGKEFIGSKGAKYCSKECKNNFKRVCKICGKEFVGSKYKKLCSKKCQHKSMQYVTLICSVCGKEYVGSKYKTHKYCSLECKNNFVSRRTNTFLLKIFGTNDTSIIKDMVKKGVNING